MADGYLIGENLRKKLGAVVKRGEAIAGAPGRKTGPLPSSDPGYFQDKVYLKAVVPLSALEAAETKFPPGTKIDVGAAIDLPASSSLLVSNVKGFGLDSPKPNDVVPKESDLPDFSRSQRTIKLQNISLGMSDNFGVVKSRSEPDDDNKVTLTLIVGGVFSCRVLGFGLSPRVAGAVPVWDNNDPYPLTAYRPLPVLAPAGNGVVLALGSYWKSSSSEWPRVYEALIRIG